jgi:hypothetical protein
VANSTANLVKEIKGEWWITESCSLILFVRFHDVPCCCRTPIFMTFIIKTFLLLDFPQPYEVIFRNVTPCSLSVRISSFHCFLLQVQRLRQKENIFFSPENGGSMFLETVSNILSDSSVSHLRRQHSSHPKLFYCLTFSGTVVPSSSVGT